MRSRALIDRDTIKAATGHDFDIEQIAAVGDLYSRHADSILSYVVSAELLPVLSWNDRITHVFCTPNLVADIPERVRPLACEDPLWAFFSLVDHLAGARDFAASAIDPTSRVQGSWFAPTGVQVAGNVTLQPFSSIYEATTIGAGTLVRSGAVIGIDSFQHQRTAKGIISPRHDGDLRIGEKVEIGASCAISRGFSYRNTIISDEVKIDANVSISHGVEIGEGSIICAGALILGHSKIGKNVFVGPGATIRNRVKIEDGARISIGSVVTRDVAEGQTVTGNFAVPHENWMSFIRNLTPTDR